MRGKPKGRQFVRDVHMQLIAASIKRATCERVNSPFQSVTMYFTLSSVHKGDVDGGLADDDNVYLTRQ